MESEAPQLAATGVVAGRHASRSTKGSKKGGDGERTVVARRSPRVGPCRFTSARRRTAAMPVGKRTAMPAAAPKRRRCTSTLEQEVLPREPIRHWVCSFPWGVRSVLGYDRELCRDAAAAFAQELSRSLKRRAKVLLPLPRQSDALTGSMCVVQRTDGALRLNVHLHVLALDGVYTEDADGTLSFHALPTPTAAEVSEIAERTAKRLHKAFQKQGRVSPWDDVAAPSDAELTDSLQDAQPGLFACYQAAAAGIAVSGERAGKPLLRLMLSPGAMTDKPCSPQAPEQPIATALGVNLYAKQLVDGRDRAQLERLCRYVMRPPLSQERLEWRADRRLLLTLKNVWKDGTTVRDGPGRGRARAHLRRRASQAALGGGARA